MFPNCCQVRYWEQLVGYITIMSGSVVLEVCMVIVSLRGTVADDKPRQPMQTLIYIKQGHNLRGTNVEIISQLLQLFSQ